MADLSENDPAIGGLDALVVAASKVSAKKQFGLEFIDPTLQVGNTSQLLTSVLNQQSEKEPLEAISSLLNNPAVVSLIAEYNLKKSHRTPSLYTQLLSSGSGNSVGPSQPPATPAQQTRYGRISRPPLHAPATPTHRESDGIQSDSQIQAIKDALENVVREEGDVTYDSLPHAVSRQHSLSAGGIGDRFWRNSEASSGGWPAETLAQAQDVSSREAFSRVAALGANVTMSDAVGERGKGRLIRKRDTSELSQSDDQAKDQSEEDGLPAWPLPPHGKGGRKNMPRDELLARRRARNRVAAQQSRQKKKQYFGSLEDRLAEKDQVYNQLENHCRGLEREIELLRKTITEAGIQLPSFVSGLYLSHPVPTASHPIHPSFPSSLPVDVIRMPETPGEMFFHDLLNMDEDDNDDEFIPPSSPKRDGDSEESDAEDEPEEPVRKRTRRRGRAASPEPERQEAEDEDEDLFLPIIDVPVPPRPHADEEHEALVKQAMNELHVDTPEELMNVVRKMAETAEYGGVTEEQVRMLSKLLALGQAQGVSVW
nr:hypothetical protein L204_04347 [Cryptococcus depauperatus CBS 7855]